MRVFRSGGRVWTVVALLVLGFLAGCSSKPTQRAPVEDRGSSTSRPAPAAVEPAAKQPPGFENAGKPGYYTVKPGDTLMRIGLDNGQGWRDIVRWNNIENPNLIEVGQVLRVVPPTTAVAAASPAAVTNESGVVTRPVTSSSVAPSQAASAPRAASSAPAAAAVTTAPAAASSNDELAWIWPAAGQLISGFDEVRNKGLDIGGKPGDAVIAAADGRVVYAGAGLRGYGNLIILKHNNTYLTAYAHNQTLLVKEEQNVQKGQKIAEMGSSDADRVKLHFEIRRQGKPVDPAKYLPGR